MGMPDSFLASVLSDRYQPQRSLSKKPGRRTLLALDRQTQQPVIIKLLTFSHDTTWEEVRLFQREAELLKTLSHLSIPQYIDAFEFETAASKGHAIVQSYIAAPSLEAHLKAGRHFSEDEVRYILESVLEILIYLHQRQPPIIHRDIKPSNILLSDRSGDFVGNVYLVDFGSVQTLANRGGKTMTVVGTYGYMPPEQFGDIAYPASDLYSLGATAIALLSQTHPADLPKTGVRIQFEDQVSVSADFQTWLQRMIAPEVAERPASAAAALRSLLSPDEAQVDSPQSCSNGGLMTPTQLLRDAIGHNFRWGALVGAIGFSIFPGLVFLVHSPIGVLFMAMLGAGLGGVLGWINGVVLGILTRFFFFPLTHRENHRANCTAVSAIVGCMVSLLVFGSLLMLAIPVMAIIGALMGVSTYKIVSRWYRQPSPVLPHRQMPPQNG